MKTVLVTGASSGLGKACVSRFAAANWNVIATARALLFADQHGDEPGVFRARIDVADEASVLQGVNRGIERFGRIDVVINNAGHGLRGLFEGIPTAEIQRQFDVNLFGTMNVCRAVLPHMRGRGSGVIVNISSAAGVFGLPLLSIYAASKFALEGFSEALSYELLSQNIVVKLVELGGMAGTSFVANSSVASLCAYDVPAYAGFTRHAEEVYREMARRPAAPVAAVADAVFNAATDGTDQLRYVVTEDIVPILKLRREGSERAFMDQMRRRFPGRSSRNDEDAVPNP